MTATNGDGPRISSGLLFSALLLINPIILALLGVSWWAALAWSGLAIVATQAMYRRYLHGLPTIYFVNVVAIAGIWLNAEALVRLRFADYVMDDLYHLKRGYYINRPALQHTLRDKEFQVEYLTNEQGYRIGYSQSTEMTVAQVDWLFLGDSYTQGAQVQFEELYTTHIYRTFPNQIVLNAGISGWGLHEALSFLRDRGDKLRPRVVVLQIGNFNDFMKVQPRTAGLTDWLMQDSHLARLLLQNIKYTNPTNLPLGRWVEPFYTTDEDNRKLNVFYVPSSPEKEADRVAFARVLGEIQKEVARLGSQLLVVQLPTKEQVSFTYLEEAVRGLNIDARLLDMELPNRRLRALGDSLGFRVIDALPEFQASSEFPYFQYDEHLTASGHALLAEVLKPELARLAGEDAVRVLSQTYQGDRYPSVMPGGDSVLFQSFRDGNSEIFVADTGFAWERQLTVDDADETHPVLIPPQAGLIFTVGDPAFGRTRLWRADANGRNPRPLKGDESLCNAIAGVSSDGRFAVFPEWRCGASTSRTRLMRFDLESGVSAPLPQAVEEVWRPVVAPDGEAIAYVGRIDGQLDIFELELATGVTSRLTSTPHDEWDPQYSPDGRWLVFAARPEGNWDLFCLKRSSAASLRLTQTRGDEWDPSFSPDGGTLLYGGEYGLFRGIYSLRFDP